MEVDDATEVIESDLISTAYAALKKTQQADKRSALVKKRRRTNKISNLAERADWINL